MDQLGSITELLDNKTILLTGATGFLAKVFVEKVLRVQPNVKRLYLLIKAADTKSAEERMQKEMIKKDLFNVLREKYGKEEEHFISFVSEKLFPICGDVSCENLGVNDASLRYEMWREIEIVLNFAATTGFNERYDVALGTNTFGALHVLNFAKTCVKLKKLVHVSTAYVCGGGEGLILEKPIHIGEARKGVEGQEGQEIDIGLEQKLVRQKLSELQSNLANETAVNKFMKEYGTQRAALYGWPNVYVLTKALGEMILMRLKDNVPLLIIRPTIITSTYKEPFPGWIEGLRTMDSVVMGYGTGKLNLFIFNPLSIIDVIPADMVVNGIIVAMVANNEDQSSAIIYHLGSSRRNPITMSDINEFCCRFFTENPTIDKDGKPIKVGRLRSLSTTTSFEIYKIFWLMPIKALQLGSRLLGQRYSDTCHDLDKKLRFLIRWMEFYKPYVFFKGVFDDTNSEKLQAVARETSPDANTFNFDPQTIDWEDYIMVVHYPALVKYA